MSDLGDDDQQWDDWVEEDGDKVPATCLLCPQAFPTPAATFAHMAKDHACDVLSARARLGLDFYDCIRLINYIRRWRQDHVGAAAESFVFPADAAVFAHDTYLKPVLQDDPLLHFDYEGADDDDDDDDDSGGDGAIRGASGKGGAQGAGAKTLGKQQQGAGTDEDDDSMPPPLVDSSEPLIHVVAAASSAPAATLSSSSTGEKGAESTVAPSTTGGGAMVTISAQELAALRNNLHRAQDTIEQLQHVVATLREAAEESMLGGARAADLRRDGEEVSAAATAASKERRQRRRGGAGAAEGGAAAAAAAGAGAGEPKAYVSDSESDDEGDLSKAGKDGYFSSYAHFGIHEEMIKDAVRTESYRNAILQNPEAFAGKVVLDVGCGTGILSMFAAQAGARKVYAIDNSDIASFAREIVKLNGFEHVIEVVKGKMEHVRLPQKVDVIISEWMGYGLLFESMLDSVLHARDAYLAPGGLVLPDKSAIYLVGLADEAGYQAHVRFWDDVYTFDMTPMREPVLVEASITNANPATIATPPATLVSLDMRTCKVADLVFSAPFALTVKGNNPLTAFCIYFDILFEEGLANTIFFNTSPSDIPTHWKQAVFHLREPLATGAGDVVSGTVTYERSKDDHRSLLVRFAFAVESIEGKHQPTRELSFRI